MSKPTVAELNSKLRMQAKRITVLKKEIKELEDETCFRGTDLEKAQAKIKTQDKEYRGSVDENAKLKGQIDTLQRMYNAGEEKRMAHIKVILNQKEKIHDTSQNNDNLCSQLESEKEETLHLKKLLDKEYRKRLDSNRYGEGLLDAIRAISGRDTNRL